MALSRARVYAVPVMSFPAIMVLVWVYLLMFQYYLSLPEAVTVIPQDIFYIAYLLYPLIGLLTDVYIGRYKAIMIGINLCFISWIITGILLILNSSYGGFTGKIWIVPGLIYLIGFIAFVANIIQYNIDQLIGASANELSTIIYWNFAANPTAWVLSDWLLLLDTVTANLLFIITSGVALSLILVSHSLFKHKLENISLIKNPIKLIGTVLCYARKHKYPENRSALTYWEVEAPSRLDLGKDKYGGPFTEEEVEDVKTFFRMLPLFIAIVGFTSALFLWQPQGKLTSKYSVHGIIFEYHGAYHITVLFLFFIYQFIVRSCLHKYIPSMLTRMGAGLVFALLGCIAQLLVHIFASYDFLIIIRQILFGITCFLIYPTSLEFTAAQSPEYMRGMMVGLYYFSMGIGSTIAFMLLFLTEKWYYMITLSCVFQLLILMVFVILAKRYKYRVRENEVNIVQIVDDHYHRYMKQEDEYKKHKVTLENETNYVIKD
uniref:Major facilitator superfamily (MFS) profile domain-containing protein n=1 Tax=Amphimedon queenslandica TaxID=400682 RepID=A0A1X7U1F1_AMPQE